MKTLLCAVLVGFGVCCQADFAAGQAAKGLTPAKGLEKEPKRTGLRCEVLQVLKEGLLISSRKPWLLTGYPKMDKARDGMVLNCYVRSTGKVHKYVDTQGAERTVPVLAWDGERSGG